MFEDVLKESKKRATVMDDACTETLQQCSDDVSIGGSALLILVV